MLDTYLNVGDEQLLRQSSCSRGGDISWGRY